MAEIAIGDGFASWPLQDEREDGQRRRPQVGVIGKHAIVAALTAHAGPDHAEPGARDVLLHVAVVPRVLTARLADA